MKVCGPTAAHSSEEGVTLPAGRHASLPLGIVIRRKPGVTRWARWTWSPVAVLPGAPPADWALLRQEGDAREYHAATLPLTLWAAETEAYVVTLSDKVPSVYVVMRQSERADAPLDVVLVTASAFEAQDYTDNGEDIVEKIPMPPGLLAWVWEFVEAHHVEEEFVKRRRDRLRVDRVEDGKGDPRIAQMSDVYRAPRPRTREGTR